MTTAAAELRAAAARLRELAHAASTDRYGRDTSTWTSHHVNERDARLFGPDRVRIIRGGSSGPHGRGVHPHLAPAHADYIAAMHPAVGLALADWLDEEADRRDACLVASIQIWGNAEHPDAAAWLTTGLGKGSAPALDLARQINTGSQT